jgi:uncharacterized protein YqeY
MSLFRLNLTRSTWASPRPVLVRTFVTTRCLCSDSNLTPTATTLTSLQAELKYAMRAKDKPRLNAIRSLLAEITNASKTTKPVETDANLYSLLSRQIKAANTALEDFEKAKRSDLIGKEQAQLAVLEELRGRIEVVGEQQVESVVRGVLNQLEEANKKQDRSADVNFGAVFGRVMKSFGTSGKPVDADVVQRKVNEVLAQKE